MPPRWCPFFSEEQYSRFLQELRRELERRDWTATLNVDEGYADLALEGWSTRLGLTGPAQKCRTREASEWGRILAEHLSTLAGLREKSRFMDDYVRVKSHLKVRLYPYPYGDYPEQLVARPLAPRLGVYPVADTPNEILFVLRSNLDNWPLSEDAVFASGLQRAHSDERVPAEVVNISPVISFHTIRGNSFFVNANALWMQEFVEESSPFGALVAVPNRHEVLFHRIHTWDLLEHTHRAMIAIARKLFDDGPGSISPEIYWWRRREWTHIGATEHEGVQVIELPDAFVAEVVEPLRAGRRS